MIGGISQTPCIRYTVGDLMLISQLIKIFCRVKSTKIAGTNGFLIVLPEQNHINS